MNEITIKNNKTLAAYEKQIDKNIKAAWYENGLIMLKIRDEGLYKEKYTTFENYLNERWDFAKARGYQLVDAADFAQKLQLKTSTIVDKKTEVLPENEAQVRPLLTGLKNDSERAKVWADVVEDSKAEDRKITAAFVQQKVDEFVASGEVVEEIDFDELKRKQDEAIAAKKASAQKPKTSIEVEKINIPNKTEQLRQAPEEAHHEDDPKVLLMEIIDNQEILVKELQSEILSLTKVFESNDQLTAALDELKKAKAISKGYEDRMIGLQNERAQLMQAAKYWQKRAEKAEKANVKSSA